MTARVLLVLAVLLAGCTGAEERAASTREPDALRVGESATYTLRIAGAPAPATLVLTLAGAGRALDASGQLQDALNATYRIEDGRNGAGGVLALSLAQRAPLHLGPAEGEPGVLSFPEPSPLWPLHPVAGPHSGVDLPRCALLGTLALPLRLLDPARPFDVAGVAYDVVARDGTWTLTAAEEGALQVRLRFDGGFFPSSVVLQRPSGDELCQLTRTARAAGSEALQLPARAAPSSVSGTRGAFIAGLPPVGDVALPFPLSEAMNAARRDARIGAFLREHPQAYLVEAQLTPDRADDLENVRTDEWILRFADTSGAAMRFAAQRSFTPAVPVDRVNVIDESPAQDVPPLSSLAAEPFDLAHAMRLAREVAGIDAPTRLQWGVALDATLVGTPDEALWQVMRVERGTRSVLVSAANGQLVAVADITAELP